jgi:GT2 family glycosyltransferase
MLGEDTIRYSIARTIFRPALRVRRALKKSLRSQKTHAPIVLHEPERFPLNYSKTSNDLGFLNAGAPKVHSEVAVVAVNEMGTNSDVLVGTLNEVLDVTPATWLFLIDVSHTAEDRALTLTTLLRAAKDNHDVVFADEDVVSPAKPLLKSPAVGPHTLLSYNVVGRPALLRVSALKEVSGFRSGTGWAFEHDLYLRLQENGATFKHVPAVLPSGRPVIAFSPSHVDQDTLTVVREAMQRRGIEGSAEVTDFPGVIHWQPAVPSSMPSIDIVIPTRDRVDLVKKCIESIEQRSTYKNWNIIICDNDSVKPETLDYFASTKYSIIPCPGPFNYAKIVNRGIRSSKADYILTLNNDTEVVTPDWLEQLVAMASLPDVSIVGACLLDGEGRREHESIVIAPYPQHLRSDSNYPHRDAFTLAIKDVAAVTGAVQMVNREFWESLGGMDEELHVVMNDVDVCLRSQVDGRHVVYTPYVQLHHEVGASRGNLDPLDDRNRFIRRWDIFGSFVDPYFPESMTLLGEQMYYLPERTAAL